MSESKIISCVISCYNEEKNLPILFDQIKRYNLERNFQIIIVNNGSTDNSNKIINQFKDNFPDVLFLDIKEDMGWGYGVLNGLKLTTTKYVGWIHSDLQYNLDVLNDVYGIIKKNEANFDNILVKGLRKKRKFIENIFTKGMSIVASIILCKKFTDINSQPNFFSRNIYKKFKNPPNDLMLDLYLYYKVKKISNHKIIRFSVIQYERLYGVSSWKKNFLSYFDLSFKQFIGIIKIRFIK